MGAELLIRFLVGGLVVSAFATLGDLAKPKSYAGLFGAAPSVALATLSLAFLTHGNEYVALNGRSMMIGALGLLVYSRLVVLVLMCRNWSALAATVLMIPAWFGISLGLWFLLLGGQSR